MADDLFTQQESNRRRSFWLVVGFILFFAWLGLGGDWLAYWTGFSTGDPTAPNSNRIFVVPARGGVPKQLVPQFESALFPVWSRARDAHSRYSSTCANRRRKGLAGVSRIRLLRDSSCRRHRSPRAGTRGRCRYYNGMIRLALALPRRSGAILSRS